MNSKKKNVLLFFMAPLLVVTIASTSGCTLFSKSDSSSSSTSIVIDEVQNVAFDEDTKIISWDEVPSAEYYDIKIEYSSDYEWYDEYGVLQTKTESLEFEDLRKRWGRRILF